MATFLAGETVICSITVKNSSGALVNPATSMQITILQGTLVILATTSMTNDGTGLYHYDYTPSSAGTYDLTYIATDSGRVSKLKEQVLVA